MMEQLAFYLSYPFVQNAILVGMLTALSASLLGIVLVARRFSFIGSGLSHVAFGTYGVAMVIGLLNDMLLVMPLTIVVALVLLRSKQLKWRGDIMVAMISVSSLAIGYLVMNVFSDRANIAADVCTTLFGSTSILTLTSLDIILSIVMSLVVLIAFGLSYHYIFAITFDQDFAVITGAPTNAYNTIFSVITAVIIVLAMNLVGSLLITALIIFPAVSSMTMFKSFRSVVISTMTISTLGALIGMILSILASTPVGSTIVAVYIMILLMASMTRKVVKR